jgi:hypothetical protein
MAAAFYRQASEKFGKIAANAEAFYPYREASVIINQSSTLNSSGQSRLHKFLNT